MCWAGHKVHSGFFVTSFSSLWKNRNMVDEDPSESKTVGRGKEQKQNRSEDAQGDKRPQKIQVQVFSLTSIWALPHHKAHLKTLSPNAISPITFFIRFLGLHSLSANIFPFISLFCLFFCPTLCFASLWGEDERTIQYSQKSNE